MSPDIQELIAELEEAERAATPGPWWVPTLADSYVHANTREVARCYASPDTRGTLPGANARLISLMRTHLPTLLEAVKRQGEALEPFARGGWGKDFYKNAPEDTPVIVKALPPEALGRSFHLTKADFDRARYVYGLFEGDQK